MPSVCILIQYYKSRITDLHTRYGKGIAIRVTLHKQANPDEGDKVSVQIQKKGIGIQW